MTSLTELYLAAVLRAIPEPQRADVDRELRSSEQGSQRGLPDFGSAGGESESLRRAKPLITLNSARAAQIAARASKD